MFIDLKSILHRTVSNVYGDLVTRRTGKAVRTGIEEEMDRLEPEQVTVIDFSEVRCLDISCADEVIGKLLLAHGGNRRFLLRGLTPGHLDALEPVLERHRLAVAAVGRGGEVRLLGPISEALRRAFDALVARGSAEEDELAEVLSLPEDQARSALSELMTYRVVHGTAGSYRPVSAS